MSAMALAAPLRDGDRSMAKKANKSKPEQPRGLSALASGLLREMASQPSRIEYNTRVLGGAFEDADIDRLDVAYRDLLKAGLVEPAGAVASFFGAPKQLFRITSEGQAQVKGNAA